MRRPSAVHIWEAEADLDYLPGDIGGRWTGVTDASRAGRGESERFPFWDKAGAMKQTFGSWHAALLGSDDRPVIGQSLRRCKG